MTADYGELFRIGDADMTNVGRRQRGSKKRIRFRYAIKLSNGGAGGGDVKHRNVFEHEVVLLWSFHSGKAVVQHDGVEIKSDRKPHPSVVDITWTEPSPGSGGFGASQEGSDEGRTFRVVCCRTKPINSPESFRKYELIVDGTPLYEYPPLPGVEGAPSHRGEGGAPGVPMSILEVLFPDGNYGCKKRTQDELSVSYRAEEDTLKYSDDSSDGSLDEGGTAPSHNLIDFGSGEDNGVTAPATTNTLPAPVADTTTAVVPSQKPVEDPFGVFSAGSVPAAPPPAPEPMEGAVVAHPDGTLATAGYGVGEAASAPVSEALAPVAPTPTENDPFGIFGAVPNPKAAPADPFA